MKLKLTTQTLENLKATLHSTETSREEAKTQNTGSVASDDNHQAQIVGYGQGTYSGGCPCAGSCKGGCANGCKGILYSY